MGVGHLVFRAITQTSEADMQGLCEYIYIIIYMNSVIISSYIPYIDVGTINNDIILK